MHVCFFFFIFLIFSYGFLVWIGWDIDKDYFLIFFFAFFNYYYYFGCCWWLLYVAVALVVGLFSIRNIFVCIYAFVCLYQLFDLMGFVVLGWCCCCWWWWGRWMIMLMMSFVLCECIASALQWFMYMWKCMAIFFCFYCFFSSCFSILGLR